MPLSYSSLAITWPLSSISGYGLYGLYTILRFLQRRGEHAILTAPPATLETSPLYKKKLETTLALAQRLHIYLKDKPQEDMMFGHPVLHGSSSNFGGQPGQARFIGSPNVACCAIEHLDITEQGLETAKFYHKYIAISRWNYEFLRSLSLHAPVHLCHQGIDTSLFHPAPSTSIYKDRFVIFSGGKFEFRKGQDIVLAAYKIFRDKHPDSLLVTAWQNLTQANPALFALSGHCASVPDVTPQQGLDIAGWLKQNGLPQDSFIDLPFTHNLLMPLVLRECHAAIFPNRCEGGTNLVAMEAMACGIPTFVSNNTGQKDLIDLLGCNGFMHQRPIVTPAPMGNFTDWGETSVDEVVAALESCYDNYSQYKAQANETAQKTMAWDWNTQSDVLLNCL